MHFSGTVRNAYLEFYGGAILGCLQRSQRRKGRTATLVFFEDAALTDGEKQNRNAPETTMPMKNFEVAVCMHKSKFNIRRRCCYSCVIASKQISKYTKAL